MTLTKEDVERALPASLKSSATQQLADTINTVVSDPIEAEHVRENFVTFSRVLTEGRFKTSDYLNAVVYTTYKLMGYSNQDAYMRTFPARYQNLLANNTSSKDIAAYVAGYHKGKLVTLILEQALIPAHVLYQDVYHAAIRQQAYLMENANSEKVQSDAANSLLTHLSKPKDAAAKIDIKVEDNSGLSELKDLMTQLAKRQLSAIEGGVETREIASQSLIEGRIIDHDDD